MPAADFEMFPSVFTVCFKEFYKEHDKNPYVKMVYDGRPLGCARQDKNNFAKGSRYADMFSVVYQTHIGNSYVLSAYLNAQKLKNEEKRDQCLQRAFLLDCHNASVEKFTAIVAAALCHHPREEKVEDRFIKLLVDHRKIAHKPVLSPEQLRAMMHDYRTGYHALCTHRGGQLMCDTLNKKVTFEKSPF